ncbi:unnamed protein product [Schistocephalus solidus]|uniref:Uncharacterized protein n=1 Tax=Schistocephalus solidus TaxID=70667 RepID=A0A183SCV8_SCHSO|nr:unnamed protein product [Schistocephalus solidus]
MQGQSHGETANSASTLTFTASGHDSSSTLAFFNNLAGSALGWQNSMEEFGSKRLQEVRDAGDYAETVLPPTSVVEAETEELLPRSLLLAGRVDGHMILSLHSFLFPLPDYPASSSSSSSPTYTPFR